MLPQERGDVYATLYAQRMFFLVTLQPRGAQFEVIRIRMPVTTLKCISIAVAAKRRERENRRQLFDQTFI